MLDYTDFRMEVYCFIHLLFVCEDDGSSSCCCWTDNERAVTLLGLHERWPCKRSRRSLRKSNNREIDTMSRLNKILERHGTIVMKNLGSVSDSSCLDVAVSVNSDSLVRESDEQFLKSLVLQACTSNTWVSILL